MATSVQLVKILTPVFDSLTQFSYRKLCVKGHIAHVHAKNHVKRERGTNFFTEIILSDVDLMLRASYLFIWLF